MKKLFTILVALHLMILPVSNANAGGMGQIVGIGVASVGVSLVASCKLKSPSVLIYMAGAAAYLMGEMAAAKAQKQKLKNEEEAAKKLEADSKSGGETQKATLEAQIRGKEEELALAKKRSMWAMAATAAFTAAAVLSAVELPPFFPPLVCDPGSGIAISMPLGAGVVAAYEFISGGGLMGAMLGAVGGAIAANSTVLAAFNVGPTRSIAMGAMAALVLLSAMEANSAASKLSKEIGELKKALAQFRLETDGKGPLNEDTTAGAAGGVTAGSTSGAAGGATGGTGVALLPNGTPVVEKPSCLGANQTISNDCSNPMKFSSPNLSFLGNQPELQQASTQATQFANAAASGDTAKANVSAASLAGQAAKLDDILKKNRAAMNQKLVAQGKKPIDYEKQTQDMLKSIQSSYQKETAPKSAQLAAYGLDKLALDPKGLDGSGQKIIGASTDAVVAVPTSDGKAADALVPSDSTSASTPTLAKPSEDSASSSLGKNLGEYETNDADISSKKEESLWKQVSNRYLLNFGKFFERNKLPAQ